MGRKPLDVLANTPQYFSLAAVKAKCREFRQTDPLYAYLLDLGAAAGWDEEYTTHTALLALLQSREEWRTNNWRF